MGIISGNPHRVDDAAGAKKKNKTDSKKANDSTPSSPTALASTTTSTSSPAPPQPQQPDHPTPQPVPPQQQVTFTHQYLGVKRFTLSTQLPISSYVPLNATFDNGLLYDFTEFDTYNKTTNSNTNTNTGNSLSSSAPSFIPNRLLSSQSKLPQSDIPLTQNESSLLAQTKWLTTLHFRDFLSNLLTEVKNATETNHYNQFAKIKNITKGASNSPSSSQYQTKLLGSAKLAYDLEAERANKLALVQEEQMTIQKLKTTSRGRKELKKRLKEQKEKGTASLQDELKNDPLNGLSAAFGYGLGVGRVVDVDEMNLPIVDQLVAMVSAGHQQRRTNNTKVAAVAVVGTPPPPHKQAKKKPPSQPNGALRPPVVKKQEKRTP